ncbi:Stk1 family PASTA domain-containing Ser/Thr kinase [Boudabousia marimammalium]|uniref:non-specific serine/threonine protein kinase n=1 Tax=Boudabousia marimammalium TaxID=156892 RepID=A0A1Q5PSQ7_9ACTO|nr:Stk1 family PASTA domain-containing Ser/Thr kinase [Boudabousia marimammalium]OKL50549.1 serine/threonine protein kinase [Boudabousia marimammalium]
MVESRAQRLAGRYELRGLIGRGGMAEVRLGYDTRLSRIVAVKMLRTDLARDSVFQERFRREAHAAASLNHPAIVAVYDTGEELLVAPDGSKVNVPYIVMEYVEGHTVRDLLQEGTPLPIDEAVEIVAGVLSALEYSHHEGLVHRDIKPGNIMVTKTNKIKVMDFGIARVLEDSQATMTQTDAVVGTAQYLSPEQAQGELVDARSDLYSTGCVLFELLTGQPPFKGDSAVAVAYQHVSEPPRRPSAVTPDVPYALDQVVLRALAKRKEDRYASASDMRADLMRAAAGGEVATVPDSAFLSTRRIDPIQQTTSMPPLPPQATSPITGGVPAQLGHSTGALPMVNESEKQKSGNRWAWIIAIIVAVIVLGSAALLWWSQSGGSAPATVEPTAEQSTTVPDVTNMTQNQAREALEKAGLVMRLQDERVFSDDVPADSVVSTDPAAGTPVSPDATVYVTLSKGPEAKPLPELAGQNLDQAQQQLKDAGYIVTLETMDDPNMEKGHVISTEPAAGSELAAGGTVKLKVASGYVKIPSNLAGKSVTEVTQVLEGLGLSVSTTAMETNSKAPDTVLTVSPIGSVEIHSAVNVKYAVAPPVAPKPPSEGSSSPEN